MKNEKRINYDLSLPIYTERGEKIEIVWQDADFFLARLPQRNAPVLYGQNNNGYAMFINNRENIDGGYRLAPQFSKEEEWEKEAKEVHDLQGEICWLVRQNLELDKVEVYLQVLKKRNEN